MCYRHALVIGGLPRGKRVLGAVALVRVRRSLLFLLL